MRAAERMELRCGRCGEALLSGATEAGCVNCLLLDALAQSGQPALLTDPGEGALPLPPLSSSARCYQHYEILTREDGSWWELGRGAMGVTYKALDVNLRVPVALKVINTRRSPLADARGRFLREARAAARLRHPNVASVFHFGTVRRPATAANPKVGEETDSAGEGVQEEECFYAMEFIEGETLEEALRRTGPFPAALVVEIARQITRALAAAEKRGLVHRDLKPANLMLTAEAGAALLADRGATRPREGMGEAWIKVIDFGLAKAVGLAPGNLEESQGGVEPATHAGFLGTPQFASPEQFAGGEVDVRSDVFSLGVVLWYLLGGELPFAGRSLAEIHDRQLHRPLPLDQLAEAKVSAPLALLLADMLAANPVQRPASAAVLHARLEECAASLHAPPPQEGSTQHRRPKPRLLSAVAAVVSLLVVVALAAGYGWTHRSSNPVVAVPAESPSPVVSPPKSVAVLPFASIGADPESASFTEGVQDEVLTDLAQVADLQVIARSSVLGYRAGAVRDLPGIGRELGVSHLVEGSVQRTGNRVRVSVQLIDARTGTCRWAEHYERDLAEVFSIQGEIAQAIVGQLQARLSPGEQATLATAPTHDPAAYQAYLRGKKYMPEIWWSSEADLRATVKDFEEATERDPQFFLAWCGLAISNLSLYGLNYDHTPDRQARIETVLQTVHRLQPDAGETHFVEGVHGYQSYDIDASARELSMAEEKLPNDPEIKRWLARVAQARGQWEENLRRLEQAAKLAPRNPTWLVQWGVMVTGLRRYREAERVLDQAIRLDPQDYSARWFKADISWEERGDSTAMEEWLRSTPDDEKWGDFLAHTTVDVAMSKRDYPAAARAFARSRAKTLGTEGWVYPRELSGGYIALLNGNQAAARTALELARSQTEELLRQRPQDPKKLIVLARTDALLGSKEKAISEGQQACALMPRSKNAYEWSIIVKKMASIYALTGEWDRAIDALHSIHDTPEGATYGILLGWPDWYPLQGYPPFDAYVASLAPKQNR